MVPKLLNGVILINSAFFFSYLGQYAPLILLKLCTFSQILQGVPKLLHATVHHNISRFNNSHPRKMQKKNAKKKKKKKGARPG